MTGIAVGSTAAYWTIATNVDDAPSMGSIEKVDLIGGPVTIFADMQNDPENIVVNGSQVVWTVDQSVLGCPAGSCDSPTIIVEASGPISAIALDETNVYWSELSGPGIGVIKKVGLSGGTPIVLASVPSGQVGGMTLDSANVYWTAIGPAGPVEHCDEDIPVMDEGTIASAPLDGGSPVILAEGLYLPGAIATEPAAIYWSTDYDTGRVTRLARK